MLSLELNLFGGFELRTARGERLILSSKKARALLAYLALSPEWSATREKLAALLWPDRGDEQARTSLRQTLSVLRRTLPDDNLTIVQNRGDSLSIDPSQLGTDVTRFEAALANGGIIDLERAAELYRGTVMDGFDVRAEPFDEWLRDERARLTSMAIGVFEALLHAYHGLGDVEAALSAALR